VYLVTADVLASAAHYFYVRRNGSSSGGPLVQNPVANQHGTGVKTIRLVAGDYIDIVDSTGSASANAGSNVSITRIGS